MALDTAESAKAIRLRNLLKAMAIKVKGLDSNDEALRQKVATELIELELGKALQKSDVTSNGEPVRLIVEYTDKVKKEDAGLPD